MKKLACLLILAAVTVGAPASAQSSSSAAALALFNDGRALEESGRYREASERFERSQELVPAVGTLLNLGACYEKLRRTASAWGAYSQAANLAVTLHDPGRQARAKGLADAIEPRVAKLTIVTPHGRGLTVTLNGRRVEPAVLDASTPVDEGRYTVEASAPGRTSWSASFEIKDGTGQTVSIPELSPPPAAPIVPVSDTRRTVGIGLEIGGGAVLAAGLVFGALAIGGWSSVEDRCPGGTCPDRATREAEQSDRDRAATFATVSTVTTLIGAAALAGGIALHLTSRRHAVALGPGGLTFTLRR